MDELPPQSEMVEELWAKSKIERLMTDLGRALDRGDWRLYRRCFADRVNINFERTLAFPEISVDADLWVSLAEHLLTPVRTHHQFSNYAIDLRCDTAEAIIYLVARHWKASDNGSSEFVQNGWYENGFVRLGGEWKVSRLLHTHQWTSGNGALFGTPTAEAAALMQRVFCEENRVAGEAVRVAA